jgi:hypothetical protein
MKGNSHMLVRSRGLLRSALGNGRLSSFLIKNVSGEAVSREESWDFHNRKNVYLSYNKLTARGGGG